MAKSPEFRFTLPSAGDALSALQKQLETKIDYTQITSGTELPPELLGRYFQYLPTNSRVVNLGSGNGVKANFQAQLADMYGHKLAAVDFNETGTSHGRQDAKDRDAKDRGIANVEHVTLDLVSGEMVERLGGRKSVGLGIMEALLCNLMGVDAEVVVAQLGSILINGGYVMVADCLTVDDPESRILLETMSEFNREYIDEWTSKWHTRYENNSQALQTAQGDHTFVVMPPGLDKQKLELADSQTLKELVADRKIERLAKHWEKGQLIQIFKRSKLEVVEWVPQVWISRAGEPLLGQIAVFQKQETEFDSLGTILSSLALPIICATMVTEI